MKYYTIPKPHYFAGKEAIPTKWKKLKSSRMSYKAGYRYYRELKLVGGGTCYEFK